MNLFKMFKRKDNEKKEKSSTGDAAFFEANMAKNNFEASKEAARGREILWEILKKRKNLNIEQKKGWNGEYKATSSYNINAAKAGSDSRAVMLDSKVSCKENGIKGNSGSPHDIEILENGKTTGKKIQAKMSNDYKKAAKYQDDEKYEDMEKLVPKGQGEKIKNDKNLKISENTRETITEKIEYRDKNGKLIKSERVDLDLIKSEKKLKLDAMKIEIKETVTASMKTGANAAGTALVINIVDDIFERREIDLKKTMEKSVGTGAKASGYTLAKDFTVNKLKIVSNETFGVAMTTLSIGNDLKNIYALAAAGVPRETIEEEAEALILRASVGFISNITLGLPGGVGASVAINYLGNKLIQKYLYSEIAIHLREMRVANNEKDKLFKTIQNKKKNQDEMIERFFELVENRSLERLELVDTLWEDNSYENINKVSMNLTGKSIHRTSDGDIENILNNGLVI